MTSSVELLGHRGARGLAPENTLAGFAHGLAIGVSGFELDCAITRDGVVVVYHDALLNPDITRGPDGRWLETAGPAVSTLTFEELQAYDVGRIRPGSDYDRRFPRQQALDGTRIPRLDDLFALVHKAGDETLRLLLELKVSPLAPGRTASPEDFARGVISVVRKSRMSQHVVILSFDWRTLAAVRRNAPEIPAVCLTAQLAWHNNILAGGSASPWTEPLHVRQFGGSLPRTVAATGAAGWAPYYEELTSESMEEARSLGLKVLAWTVNEPADMRRMMALGVDGIISDYPDRLRQAAADAGIPLPPPLTLHA